MDSTILRRVQMEQLEILKEIKRVCQENNINYFLDSGTLIGSIRHRGFIPWDDDIDIGMIRDEYDRFASLAPEKLKSEFYWQSWITDTGYALPFGKVRRRGTEYIEEKTNNNNINNGFYVDIFPFDYAPNSDASKKVLIKRRVFLARCMLMKHHYTPWICEGKIDYKKRTAYFIYQFVSWFLPHEIMTDMYEKIVRKVPMSDTVYEQIGKTETHYYSLNWLNRTTDGVFEGETFCIPIEADKRLNEEYGDYMILPPEDKRVNRHGVWKIRFTNGEEYYNA